MKALLFALVVISALGFTHIAHASADIISNYTAAASVIPNALNASATPTNTSSFTNDSDVQGALGMLRDADLGNKAKDAWNNPYVQKVFGWIKTAVKYIVKILVDTDYFTGDWSNYALIGGDTDKSSPNATAVQFRKLIDNPIKFTWGGYLMNSSVDVSGMANLQSQLEGVDRHAALRQLGLGLIAAGAAYVIPDSSAFKKCVPIPVSPPCRMPKRYGAPTSRFCRKNCMPNHEGETGDDCPPNCCKCSAPGLMHRLTHYFVGFGLMGLGSYIQVREGIAIGSVIVVNGVSLALLSNAVLAYKCDYHGLAMGSGCF